MAQENGPSVCTLLHSRTRVALTLITVSSLAAGGLAFVVRQKMLLPKGARYEVVFFLNDRQPSRMCEAIIIQHRQGKVIAAAFAPSERYRYDLHLYLMPTTSTSWSA